MDGMYDTIEHGWLVTTADDKKIGTVGEVNTREGYLHLRKGWFFTEDLYVPLEAIASVGDGSVRLAYTQGEIEERHWDTPPPTGVEVDARGERDEPTVVMHRVGQAALDEGDDALTLRLHEEELVPRTQTVEQGRLGVHKEVVEEPETIPVQVRHDEVYVERVPMDVDYTGTDAFREMEIEIPLMSDRLYVGKRAHVVEEVRVYKRTVVEEQQVTDHVRKERVHVEEVDVDDDTTGRPRLR